VSSCVNSVWQYNLATLLTLLVCVAGALLVLWVLRKDFAGRSTFVLVVLAGLWWMLATGFEVASAAPACKLLWATLSWPGAALLPISWAVFLWQYVGSIRKPLSWLVRLGLLVAPGLVWLMALSNPWHGLFYSAGTAPLSAEFGAPIRYRYGPLFYLAMGFCYLFVIFSIAVALRAASANRGVYRYHYLGFVLITLLPWAVHIAHIGFAVTLFGVNPAPFSFLITLSLFSLMIVSAHLFDLLPVARGLLFEMLADPVLLVDTHHRVVEANYAALQLGGGTGRWQGCKLEQWPVIGADLSTLLLANTDQEEHLLSLSGPARYFEVRIRNIERAESGVSVRLGRMIYLRDVTRRHLDELELAEALALSETRLSTISSLHERLQEQALRDPLTGLYNRRYLDEFFVRELCRAQREKTPLSLALIDLDHFKRINDRYGHLDGDDVLKAAAQHLQESLRGSDAVFRIGGEEFLVILPGAHKLEAYQRLEGICRRLAERPVTTRGGHRHVTLSAGLACWPEHGQALDALMQAADAALYEAKRSGRNRVCISAGDTPVA
jgi:diguanylate cyclase (GGDEF)-like protein